MTLTLPYNEIQYVSDGVIDTYSFSTFAIQNLTQLVVDIYNAAGVLVNPALYPYDANITDPTSDLPRNSIVFSDDVPPENYIIVISRLTEQTQEVSFSTLGGYNSKNLENILSKIVQMIQEEGYKLDHNVPALDPLQTDWLFDRLLTNNSLLYIDTINKTIKQTSFPKENVVQATGGMYLRQVLQNGYYIVEYSMDNVNWTPILNGGAADYHNNLLGRDVADAHPASAITGVAEHIADTDNPHSVTKTQVGLGNCDNTSDADKPISDATQDALDLKADLSGATFTGDISANNLSGINTGDETDSTIKTKLGITTLSGSNTGDQDLSGYALDNSVVHLSGNETIADVKTFSSFPVTPSSAPTTDYEVVNKKYVDDNAGGGGSSLSAGMSLFGLYEELPSAAYVWGDAGKQELNSASTNYSSLVGAITGGLIPSGTIAAWDAAYAANPDNAVPFWGYDSATDKVIVPNIPRGYAMTAAGSLANVGTILQNAAPNITGTFGAVRLWGTNITGGCFARTTTGSNMANNGTSSGSNFSLDASRVNAAYGRDSTTRVRNDQIQMRVLFYVGAEVSPQTASQITAAGVLSDVAALNGLTGQGGATPMSDYVIETYVNGTTWYRLYKSGWVEQGGIITSDGQKTFVDATLPLEMSDANYTISATTLSGSTDLRAGHVVSGNTTTTSFRYGHVNGAAAVEFTFSWQVSGMAA